MLNADEPVVDVASGDPLLGEQTQKKVTPSGTMGKDRPQAHDFSKLDVQNSIPRALTRPSVGIEGTYHDMRWAYAFTANVIGTIVTALLFGHSALKRMSLAEIFPSIIYSAHEAPHDLEWIPAFFLGLGLVLLVIGFAMGVLHSFANRAQLVVWSTIFLVALVWLLAILLIAGFKWTGLAEVLALIFFIAALVIFNLRARFRLGAAVLKVASVAIKSMPGTILTSLYMGGLQLAWVWVSLVAAIGSLAYLGTDETLPGSTNGQRGARHVWTLADVGGAFSNGRASTYFVSTSEGCFWMEPVVSAKAYKVRDWRALLMLFWLVTMAWGCFVIKSVVTSTVSGSIAAWWSSSNDVKPVKAAFYRATHHSFGTLCKAGVVVNAGVILFFILRHEVGLNDGFSFLFNVAQCSVIYFLDYNVTFAAAHGGLEFAAAVRRVRQLFTRHGVTIVGNDVIVSFVMSFLSLSMLFALAAIPWLSESLWSHKLRNLETNIIIPFFVGFGLMFVLATVLEVVRSATKAVHVLLLEETHGPELLDQLTAAWVKIHPKHNNSRDVTTPCTETLNTGHAHAV